MEFYLLHIPWDSNVTLLKSSQVLEELLPGKQVVLILP